MPLDNPTKVIIKVVHGLDLQVFMGLVMAKCAKPNEYNILLMFEALTMFPVMVEDHVMNFEYLAQLGHMTSPTHEYAGYP